MSTVYTGVPGNIGAPTPVTATIPADGDPRNAASVNPALQKLTDYIAFLEQQSGMGLYIFAGTPPNTASTSNWLILNGTVGSPTVNPSTLANNSQLYLPKAVVVRAASVRTSVTTVGGTVTVDPTGFGPVITIPVSSPPQSYTSTGGITIAANTQIGAIVINGAGVTTSIGACLVSVLFALA